MTNAFAGQITSPADAARFVFAGHAILTLKSLKTGARYTYRIEQAKDGPTFFVNVLTGPENTRDYQYLGYFRRGLYSHGVKSPMAPDALAAQAFAYFAKQLDGLSFSPSLEVWHEGRCCRCGRTLTIPASIKAGVGSECAAKMGIVLEAEDPVAAPQPAPTITVTYESVDASGMPTVRSFKRLKDAHRFAVARVGFYPEFGNGYAVSDDGIGTIQVEGCTLEQLFSGA